MENKRNIIDLTEARIPDYCELCDLTVENRLFQVIPLSEMNKRLKRPKQIYCDLTTDPITYKEIVPVPTYEVRNPDISDSESILEADFDTETCDFDCECAKCQELWNFDE